MREKLTHAGAVVYRCDDGRQLFLVVSSSDGQNHVLPKGHIESNELPPQTALRELTEEAGVRGNIEAALSIKSFAKQREQVVVQYYLVRATATGAAAEQRSIDWLDAVRAHERLSFDDSRQALDEAVRILKQRREDENC